MSGKMKRTTSKKSHSWWWDSHISPKNSKWLAENLEDMDQSVKRMLKLIEEDGDSFAKKAEMYYQKRPELVSHVENFYRMYRSLAERYDHVTGELRKNIPSELHSQNSGSGSDFGSEPPSPSLSPSPERKPTRLKLKHRAPGFDFFLGSGGSSDHSRKEGDTSSESGSESDDASSNNHISSPAENGVGSGLHQRIIELEDELRDLKEKLCALEEEKADGMHKHAGKGDYGEFKAKISSLEEELLVANQKVRVSEEEIESLRREFENRDSDMTIGFQRELESAREGMKLEKKKTSELLERIVALEADVSDRDHTIEELKKAIADANENISKEKSWLQLELKGLSEKQAWLEADLGLLESRKTSLEDQITRLVEDKKEMQSSHEAREIEMSTEVESLKVENAERCKRIEELNKDLDAFKLEQDMLVAERDELNAKISALQAELHSNEAGMHSQIESAKAENAESCRHIEELNKDLDALKLKHNMLVAERDELNAKALALSADLSSREDKIRQMDDHLRGLHVEHVQLIAGSDGAKRVARELTGRVKELEVEVERLRVAVSEAAEEKREVIRQLCFSLDHFRDGYQQLRQALHGHKGSAVLAS